MNNYPVYSNVAGSTSTNSPQQRYYGDLGNYSAPSTPPRRRHASNNAASPIRPPPSELKPYSKSTYSPTYAVNMMKLKGRTQRVKSEAQVEYYTARARGNSISFSYQSSFLVNVPAGIPPPRCQQNCLLEYKDAQFPVFDLPDFVPISVVDPSEREELKLVVHRPRETPLQGSFYHYIPFKDCLDITEGGQSLGISMAQLLATDELTLERSLRTSSDLNLPDIVHLQIRLNGYGITTHPIDTRCAHGEVSCRSLAIVIARIYASVLIKPASSSTAFKHRGCEGLPIPKFNELRLVGLYRARGAVEWHTDLAYVAKPRKPKSRKQ